MTIFQSEINDGLEQEIAKSFSFAMSSTIEGVSGLKNKELLKAIAENQNQSDLYYFKSVLVSTGWNDNDDIFHREEVWAARNTPEDKQTNLNHNEKEIVGHMTSSFFLDDDHNILTAETLEDLPEYFNIGVGSVLYTCWTDSELEAKVASIIYELEHPGDHIENPWGVSMECLYPHFDYSLKNEDGTEEIIKREESTAYLTKYLKRYGGAGVYNGRRIGRLLRDYSFSGVALTKNPANPKSVILNNLVTASAIEANNEEKYMQEELEAAKAQLDSLKSELDTVKASLDANVSKISELGEALNSVTAERDSLAAQVKEMSGRAEAAELELGAIKKEKMKNERKACLSKAGVAEAELDETVNQFESLDNETFEAIVKILAKKVSEPKVEEKVEDEKPQDEECADASVLDTAEASTNDIPMGESFVKDDMKSYASKWFSENVLKNIKK